LTVSEAVEQEQGIVPIHLVRRCSQQTLQSIEQLLGHEAET
jgi:hypothetical protein